MALARLGCGTFKRASVWACMPAPRGLPLGKYSFFSTGGKPRSPMAIKLLGFTEGVIF